MILALLDYLIAIDSGFAVLGYLTTRSAFALITALVLMLLLGPVFIRLIQRLQFGQIIRTDGPQSHQSKQGTPTMGGLLIILSFVLSSLIWGDLSYGYFWIVIFSALSFTTLGFVDDYLKIAKQNSKGVSARLKLFWQSIFAVSIVFLLITAGLDVSYLIPSLKDYSLNLSVIGFIIMSILLIVGFSNATNLTDGLDGLAIMPVVIISSGLAIYAYLSTNSVFAGHLNLDYMPDATEMSILLVALVGSGLGFLWFNTYPAQIFMGDSGSLSLGAILITIAIVLRQEIIFILMSVVFIVEMFSVMIQVGYYKYTKKRFFLMAPLHHHFELKGYSEPKIIVRAWLITLLFTLIAIALIKIR